MELVVSPSGQIRCLYGEAIDLAALGLLRLRRASFVEPGPSGDWHVDLGPVSGPLLGGFARRSAALAAETAWLSRYWLQQLSGE